MSFDMRNCAFVTRHGVHEEEALFRRLHGNVLDRVEVILARPH